MKKLLMATLLASVCGMSFAQSSVNLFGVLDQSYIGVNNASGANARFQNGMSSNSSTISHFGIKGSEDMGGGWKTGFNLESQVNLSSGSVGSSTTGTTQATTGTSEVFNRAANVTVGNAQYGEFKFGRQAIPTFTAAFSVDALGVNSLGLRNYYNAATTMYGASTITGVNAGTNIGGASVNGTNPHFFANGIGYATPTYAGVSGLLFTSPGSGNLTSQNSGAQKAAAVNYAGSGKLDGFKATFAYGTTDSSPGGAGALTNTTLGASYAWDKFKVSAARTSLRFNNSLFATPVGDNLNLTSFGVKYQVTAPLWLGVEYTTAQDTTNGANKSSTLGLAANYDLSKRTALYGLVGSVQNSGAAAITPLYASGAVGVAGMSYVGYAAGFRHAF